MNGTYKYVYMQITFAGMNKPLFTPGDYVTGQNYM